MAIVGFVLWLVFIAVVRVLSFVLIYWACVFVGSMIVGVIVGVLLPLRVLAGKGHGTLRQIVPQDLVDGRVAGAKPAGPNREHGWDRAWPNYMPYQAKEDAKAVGGEVADHTKWLWSWLVAKGPTAAKGSLRTRSKKVPAARIFGGVPRLLWWALIGAGASGYTVGLYASAATWFAVMGVIGVLSTILQKVALLLARAGDVLARRRQRASMMCTDCYGESTLPGFRCSAPACTITHWTMLPGPLGSISRRCECGQQLPNTVRRAARELRPFCPYCGSELVVGSGARQTIQLAVIGSMGAGKSRLLDAITIELEKVLTELGGTLTPLNDRAREHQVQAQSRLQQHAANPKTAHVQPVGLPFALTRGSTTVEAQIMDVAGEAFSTWNETAKLRYLDSANGIVLALDALALPEVRAVLRRSSFANSVLLASGDQEEAYAAAVDRMRADQVRTEKRGLAVVLTKADLLVRLPTGGSLTSGESTAIRSWLVANGAELMVRRFEKDFRQVRYFVADSMEVRDIRDPLNPWWTMDWLLGQSRSSLKLGTALTIPVKRVAPDPVKV